jgi:RNA polymerase sigma-70 factor (ECF subfamily)
MRAEAKALDEFQTEIVDLLPRLRRMARVLAHNPADADDLVQVAVERALERRSQWAPGTRLNSWVFRIMKNAWIDETRSRTRKRRVFASEAEGDHIADDRVASMETRLEASAVERALAALPDEQRLPIALVLIEGLSYREAAEVLELPMGTVTSRLVRGRMALMAQLGEGGA